MLKNSKYCKKTKIGLLQKLLIVVFILLLCMLKLGCLNFMDFFTCITTIIKMYKGLV